MTAVETGSITAARTATVVVDTREQTPLTFTLPTIRATLDCGDYSIVGLEHLIAVERKTLGDLVGCIGGERERFKRELQKLKAHRFRLLVIECSEGNIRRATWTSSRTKIRANHVYGSLASWTAGYGLPVWLAGDHEGAGTFAERFLVQSARHIAEDYGAAKCLTARQDTEVTT